MSHAVIPLYRPLVPRQKGEAGNFMSALPFMPGLLPELLYIPLAIPGGRKLGSDNVVSTEGAMV